MAGLLVGWLLLTSLNMAHFLTVSLLSPTCTSVQKRCSKGWKKQPSMTNQRDYLLLSAAVLAYACLKCP